MPSIKAYKSYASLAADDAVLVNMVTMDVVQMTFMQEIGVIAMGNHCVLCFGIRMHMLRVVTCFGSILFCGKFGAHSNHMFINMIHMRMMHVSIV